MLNLLLNLSLNLLLGYCKNKGGNKAAKSTFLPGKSILHSGLAIGLAIALAIAQQEV